jgi:hypothetical protein
MKVNLLKFRIMAKQKKVAAFVQQERTHFMHMLAQNPNYFGNIPGSKLKPVFKLISNTSYEQLTCVGYNPDTENMEATFSIKQSAGFSGSLCTAGSLEYLRFYLDLHDGNGFIDQGHVAINTHDLPTEKDCKGNSIFPITYVATLKKKTPKKFYCDTPVLPTLRVILSWAHDPPENSPNWAPAWGSVMNGDIQLKPSFKLPSLEFEIADFLAIAKKFPTLTIQQLSSISGIDAVAFNPQPEPPHFKDLLKYSQKLKVPSSRFAFKTVQKMIKYPTSEITMLEKDLLAEAKIDLSKLINELSVAVPLDKSKANVDYEELECIGLDYNTETLVATIKIKKNAGYSGNLCSPGSKEYIAFWIDWEDDCVWKYLNTVEIDVHDIAMPGNSLWYSVSLPLNAVQYRKICKNPYIVRVRGVLSWNHAPSTTDPEKLEYYGNRVDTHIQIKPGIAVDPEKPFAIFNIIGGIDVAHVDDATGLTKPGSFFAYNGLSVPTSAPFGGVIVLNGPTFPGYRYRIRIINQVTGVTTHVKNSFTVVGYLPYDPYVQYTTQAVDSDGYYPFLAPEKNTLNVLARFSPGTEDQFLVVMDVFGHVGNFSQMIQMDNTAPVLLLKVDDGGDCTYYSKGDTITGHFYVYDKNIQKWSFGTTWGGDTAGTTNTAALPGNDFSVPTGAKAYACGNVSLYAIDKTIVNSQSVGYEAWASYNVCLKEKKIVK